MKAVQTKYLGPTNTKGSRIKAWADGWGSKIISYPHEYNSDRAHYEAALALLAQVNLHNAHPIDPPTISGGLPNGDMCFCFKDSEIRA